MADITVVGNVNNPELKYTPSGKAVLNFSLAENHRKNNNGEWVDDGTTWRQVAVWEWAAEALADVLATGQRVVVVGQERLREFDTKDGGKGKSLEMTARHVGIIPKRDQQGQQAGGFQQQGGGGYQQAQPQQGQPSYSQGQQQQGWGQPPQQDPWAAPQADERPF